jgi:catechol 2,3-dioxygenase-like lactoylglutathione lyase family enzyme
MRPRRLDHVALWVSDPEQRAAWTEAELGMHVIERTEQFVLVGWDGRRGKLTLFDAEGPREAGALERVVLALPGRADTLFELDDGLVIETHAAAEGDLLGVVLRSREPELASAGWQRLGLAPVGGPGVAVSAGGARLELASGRVAPVERPLLNHLGVLVDSADDELRELRARDVPVADVVDAPNTFAVFVVGPGGVVLEYVEHKRSFALV